MNEATQARRAGDYQTAMRLFEEILRDNPNLPAGYVGIGETLLAQGDPKAAEAAFRQALRVSPDSFEANLGLGRALHRQSRLVDAIASYHRALVIDPDSALANISMALAYLQMDNAAGAVPFAERAVKLDPKNGPARVNLGVAYERLNRLDDAIVQYETSLELIDPTPQILRNLLNAYASAQRYKEAANTADALVRLDPSSDNYERLGWAHFKLGDFQKSFEYYRKSTDIDPANWVSINGMAVNAINRWLLSGRQDRAAAAEASSYFRRSLQLNPDQPKVVKLITSYGL